MKVEWLWPCIIIVSTIAAAVVTLVVPLAQIRPLVVMWFLFFCPGMALMRFLRLHDVMAEWTLAIALSLALDAIVATSLMYAGRWSPLGTLIILMSLSASCALVQVIATSITSIRAKSA